MSQFAELFTCFVLTVTCGWLTDWQAERYEKRADSRSFSVVRKTFELNLSHEKKNISQNNELIIKHITLHTNVFSLFNLYSAECHFSLKISSQWQNDKWRNFMTQR